MPKKQIHRSAELLLNHFEQVFLFYIWILLTSLVVLFYLRKEGAVGLFLLGGLLGVVLWEIFLRTVLSAAYGRQYRFAIFSFFLVNHPVYGVGFRQNCRSKELDFLIFDKFAFPPGTGKLYDLELNRKKRNVFNINSLGFRGQEFDSKQKKTKLRIFCSGGSTTAGDCNDDAETWPARLEQELRQKGIDAEVINSGVQGWYSYQEWLRFKEEIVRYQADIVLLHQGWNEEFEYSSLSLGTKWKPKVARNVVEQNNLYCPANRWLSQTRVLSFYLLAQKFLKEQVFALQMNFNNPKRWEVLLRNDYIVAWFDNLIAMARLAQERNIQLFTIDYPGLVELADTPEDRQTYVANSRLTPLYADYQAVSKRKISRTLKECAPLIPCLDCTQDFNAFEGEERLALFHDEIHMTPQGNALFAKILCAKLMSTESFQKRIADGAFRISVDLNVETIRSKRALLKENPSYLDRFIESRIERLQHKEIRPKDIFQEVPEDRYTTF